jgi:glycosyltransferase involved in cell wall biosynthesis
LDERLGEQVGGPDSVIAVVCDSTGFGGAEVYLTILAEALRDRRRFVAFVPVGAHDEAQRVFRRAGAEVVAIPGLGRMPTVRGLVSLTRALRDLGPDVVHVNLTDQGDGLVSLLAARCSGRPVASTLHLVVPGRTGWREWVSGVALSWLPDTVVGVSAAVAGYAERLGARSCVVLNGLDPVEPAEAPRRALGLEADRLVVGGVGRLDDQKGWDVLGLAARGVRRERDDIEFVVVGEGPDGEKLRRQFGDVVRFVGFRPDARSLFGAFDIVAMPSRYEGFGLSAVDAMQSGVPVVASRVGGLPEVVAEAGVLVRAEDPDDLAGAILRLASSPEERERLAGLGAERAARLFTARRMADETDAVYTRLVAGRRSR